MATVSRNLRWWPQAWIYFNSAFLTSNICTRYDDHRNEMAKVFLNLETMHFWRHRCVPNRSHNVFTTFSDDRRHQIPYMHVYKSFEPRSVQTWLKLWPVGLSKKPEKRKLSEKRSQNRYISPPCEGANSQPICTKFGEFVDLTDVINASLVPKYLLFLSGREVEKQRIFSLKSERPI